MITAFTTNGQYHNTKDHIPLKPLGRRQLGRPHKRWTDQLWQVVESERIWTEPNTDDVMMFLLLFMFIPNI